MVLKFEDVPKIMEMMKERSEKLATTYDKTRPVQKNRGNPVMHGRKDRLYFSQVVRLYRVKTVLNDYIRKQKKLDA